jgi:opacity protein-like surface antigen
MKKLIFIILGFLLFGTTQLYAQYASTKINDKHQVYIDSLKQVKYNNLLPIWGQKVYQKGFDIPYPTGVMVNYVYAKQGLIIENMRLGLKTDNIDLPLTGVDFIEFGNNYTTASTVMVRPDIWVLPFLNVYGLFGRGNSKTEVNLKFPFELQSIVEQQVNTNGFGLTAAAGIGALWLAVDGNITWNKPELLKDPVQVKTFGLRLGQNFVNKSKPYRNFGVWAGAMSIALGSNTVGEITLNEALPPNTWERADEIVASYYDWYDNTATIAQKIIADKTLGPIVDAIDGADGDAIIRYGLDKRTKQKWNGIIGAQYQHNKNWMFRSEAGIIGDRKSFLLSVNWRFLL